MSETKTMETKAVCTIDPANGKEIKRYPFMSDEKVEEAIAQCHEAFLEWRFKPKAERAKLVKEIGKSLQDHKDELVKLMTQEMGKLLKQGNQEVDLCTAICDYVAEHGPERLKDEHRKLSQGGRGIITYSPIGVIYGIQPWNFPAYQVIRYSVANLMAGNGVLLKHAENVTGSAKLLEKIFKDAGLPDDIFKVLIINHEQSDDVITNDHVRGVTLTGSPAAGRTVGKKSGSNLKKTVLELGSNDAYLVLEDADLDRAVKMCAQGRIYNNGETCVAAKRFIVVDAVYDDFRDAFVAAMKDIKMGDPTGDNADIGPMAREDLRHDLDEQVQESVEKGAEILCGGKIPDRKGFYYPSTVLGNVKPGQPAYDDELFGPVASLIHADDAEDAMRIANESRFGLGGGIFSEDVDKATELAANHFDTGMIFINGFGLAQPEMPFGGVKNSGYGREHGGFGIREFVNAKSLMIMAE